jgi:hypothetical protein
LSGLLDFIPPWVKEALGMSPGWAARMAEVMQSAATRLFGTGDSPPELPPPPPPEPPPDTGGSGPAQEAIEQLSAEILRLQEQITAMQSAAADANTQSADNSQSGRATNEGLLSDQLAAAAALAPQGSTPDAQAAALAAMQKQIDALTQNVADKAANAQGIADTLRNLGAGMPGMGMPPMGMPGMGGVSPLGMGGMGAPPAVTPITPSPAPEVTAKPLEDTLKPPVVTPVSTSPPEATPQVRTPTPVEPLRPVEPLTPAAVVATPPPAPSAAPASSPGPTDRAATPPAGAAAGDKQITLPSGQVVTAPNAAAAEAVRSALSQPAGKGDVATTAYSGTGVSLPTDGEEPGRKIDPADLQPGDIAVFDDHTALVAGNGQLVDADGSLQPLGVINDNGSNFHGFYRPTETTAPETADAPAAVNSPATAGVSASTTAAPPNTAAPAAMATPLVAAGAATSKPGATPAPPADNVR